MSKKQNIVNYLLLIFFVATSGVPNFKSSVLYIPLFFLLVITFILRSRKLDRQFLLFILLLVLITVFQSFKFSHFSYINILGVFLPICNAYLILKILDFRFTFYFVKLMKTIALISIFIYFPTILFPSFINVLDSLSNQLQFLNFSDHFIDTKTIIIYNVRNINNFRNPGPFWEPGLYVGYLILAYIFNIYNNLKNKRSNSIVFIIAIITTHSTTGYIAFFTFLLFYNYKSINNKFLRYFAVTALLGFAYYSFINFDFLGEKIQEQIEVVKNTSDVYRNNNTQRFLNILRDMEDFKGHEIFGRGSLPINRYSYDAENQIRTVGFTDFLVRNGIIVLVVLIVLLFKSFKSFTNYHCIKGSFHATGIFLSIWITLFSQIYFQYQFYWVLPFLFFIYNNPSYNLK